MTVQEFYSIFGVFPVEVYGREYTHIIDTLDFKKIKLQKSLIALRARGVQKQKTKIYETK